MIRGARESCLPSQLERIEAPADKLRKSLDKVWPVVRRRRKLIVVRLHWAVSALAALAIAALLVRIGAAMAGLPFLLALLSGPGLAEGDGLAVILGRLRLIPGNWPGTAAFRASAGQSRENTATVRPVPSSRRSLPRSGSIFQERVSARAARNFPS